MDSVRSVVKVRFQIFRFIEILVLDYVSHEHEALNEGRVKLTIGMSSCPDAIHGYE